MAFIMGYDVISCIMVYTTAWWLGYTSERYDFVSWDDDIPNVWNKQCFKPPTRWPFQEPMIGGTHHLYDFVGISFCGDIPTKYGQTYDTNVPP